jgi:hypothetical protein
MKVVEYADIENLLDFDDIVINDLYDKWDSDDKTKVGLIEILLFQEIKNYKASIGDNKEFDSIKLRIDM